MRKIFDKIPFEFILLSVIICAALTVIESKQIYTAFLLLIPCGLLAWKVNFFKGIFAAAGVLLLIFSVFIRQQPSEKSFRKILNDRPVYGKMRIEITDPLSCSLPYIRQRSVIQIKVHEICDSAGTIYRGDGKFLVYSQDKIPATASFGDVFEIYGTLRFAESVNAWSIEGEFADSDYRFGNFQRYMGIHGIDGIVSLDKNAKIAVTGKNDSFFCKMLLWRDKALHFVTSPMRHAENRALTAAMFFGLKGALDTAEKQQFIKSGTIHLFSVSGLHIGILFAILLPLLVWVPVRWRYLCATLLLIPFLLTTGMNIPAVRAFLMILFFAVLRCCCFTIPPLRILALGCSLFLIWQYKYLQDAGFLYSFGITAILLMVSENAAKWNKIWNIENTMKAANRKNPHKYSRRSFWWHRIIFALAATTAAFLFGSIITLFAFGYLYLSAIWINFFIIFYCPLLIYVFLLHILIAPFAGGHIFDNTLSVMQEIISFGAAHPVQLHIIPIPVISALIFYIVLISMLYVRNKKYFVCGAVFIIFFFPVHSMFKNIQKSALLVIRDQSAGEVAFVLADPGGNFSCCFNIQNTQSLELARKFLASKGINHVNIWMMYGSPKNKITAVSSGMKNMKILKIVHISRSALPDSDAISSETVYDRHNMKLNNWHLKVNQLNFFRKKAQIGFEYFDPQAIIPLCVIFDHEKQLLSIVKDDKTVSKKYTNSNLLEYSVYEL